MTETPTPGQVAYEVYARALNLQKSLTWAIMPLRHRDAWAQAAQAVLAHALRQGMPPTGTLTPTQWGEEMRRLVGQYWAGVDVDAYMGAVRGEEDTP